MDSLPSFDFAAFTAAFNDRRRQAGLDWHEFADRLWLQSDRLNAQLGDHALCGGAISRLPTRSDTSCQYALFLLRWLDRAPEEFLTGPVVDVGEVRLPAAGPSHRLRWNLPAVHVELDTRRSERGLTWSALAAAIGCSPARLTNLRTAKQADLDLVMRVVQWLRRPSSAFIHAATW